MLLVPIIELIWAFGLVFISCELAGRISSACETFNDEVNQFQWYLFPTKIQRMLPMVIANTQRTIGNYSNNINKFNEIKIITYDHHFIIRTTGFKCFGSAMCERETFKKVRENHLNSFFYQNLVLLNEEISI